MDGDRVDITNLQRQILHRTTDIGRPKVESATETLRALNPDVEVIPYPTRLTVDNVEEILKDYDLIVDGSDNFETRYLVNDACYLLGKTNVHGSIFQFEGMATVFAPERGPCYRCLYPTPPPPGLVPS
jgi:adenylyltransferase/sulfurtransferase